MANKTLSPLRLLLPLAVVAGVTAVGVQLYTQEQPIRLEVVWDAHANEDNDRPVAMTIAWSTGGLIHSEELQLGKATGYWSKWVAVEAPGDLSRAIAVLTAVPVMDVDTEVKIETEGREKCRKTKPRKVAHVTCTAAV